MSCLIAGPDHNIKATGYNGFPRGINDDVPERYNRPEKYNWFEHDFRNAVYAAARPLLEGSTVYMRTFPCMDCARAVVQVGITEVVIDMEHHEAWAKTTPKYGPDFERVEQLFKEAGVKLTGWRKDAEG